MHQEYTDFKEKKARLATLLKSSADVINDLAMPQFAANLKSLGEKVDSDTFKIQIVGTFKNGKSTFINALLGEDILPTRVLPCTAVINEIKYGQEKRAVLHFRDPLPEQLLSCIPEPTMKHMQEHGMKNIPPMEIEYDQMDRYVVIPVDGNPDEISQTSPYRSVELFYPSPLLREGVEIIDSPGLNENDERTTVTLDYLDKADAIIYLFDALRICAQDEMDFINDVLLPKGFDEMFFLINRIDMVSEEREKEDVQRYCENKLQNVPKKGMYPISSLQAVRGKMNNDEDLYRQSGMDVFERLLADFLTRDKGRIKLAQPARELKGILTREALFKAIPMQRAQLDTNLETLRQRYNTVSPQLTSLETRKRQLHDSMLLEIVRCENELRRAVIDEYNRIAKMINAWVDEYEPQTTIKVMTKGRVKKVQDEIVKHVSQKIKDAFAKWKQETFSPLIQEKVSYILESSEKDLEGIFADIDKIQEDMSGVKVELEGAKGWVRVAGAVGAYLGFGHTGGKLMSGSFDFTGIAKSLAIDIGVFTGLVLLGLTNPVILLGAVVVLVCRGILDGGRHAMKDLKDKTSEAITNSFSEDASKKADEIIKNIDKKLMQLVDNAMTAIDIEIGKVKSQVETVINEMNAGKENVDRRKQLIDRCERQAQSICSELDRMVFDMLGVGT